MTPEETQKIMEQLRQLQSDVMQLKAKDGKFSLSDRFRIFKTIQFDDGIKVMFGGTKGIYFGTSALQKLGFFGTAPVVQATAINAPSSAGVGYNQLTAQSSVDAINSIRTALKNIGITA